MAPPPPTPPADLGGALQRFGLARDRMRVALAKGAGMAETDLDALEYLEAEGPLTQRQLGQRLGITSGAVTMLADRLEARGWLERRPHPTDRRATMLELSARALEVAPAELDAYHQAVRALAAAVPAEHRVVIAAFLDRAAEAASSTADGLTGATTRARP